jgi:hypothetical protein
MHLHCTQQQMKKQADKNRTERVFSVGDRVFLKLQPYCQSSLVERQNHKLSFRFFGPYIIVKQINPVAYELDLQVGSSVHPVFHVSQLKAIISPQTPVSHTLPNLHHGIQVPETVLATRLHRRAGKVVKQLLIKWSGWHSSLATWEEEADIKQSFPSAPAWGQVGCPGGKMSATTPKKRSKTRVPETSAKRWTRKMARVGREENNSGEASECRGPTSASLVRNGDREGRPMGQCKT